MELDWYVLAAVHSCCLFKSGDEEFILLTIYGARMTTKIPQVAGTNPGIGPFQPELLSYDSSPLVCSVTIWWLSVKV